jgi:hypothetical protein
MTTPAEISRRNREYYGQGSELPTPVPYERRFIAYIDILGWSEAYRDRNKLNMVAEVARHLSELPRSFSKSVKDEIKKTKGVVVDPIHQESEVVAFSDSLAVSTPVGVDYTLFFKFLTFVCRDLLTRGFLTRGGVTVGDLYHKENMIFGPALVEAVTLEKEAIYPRLVCGHVLIADIESRPNYDPNNPRVLINDQLGRPIVNLLAFANRSNPVNWYDLEKTIAENIAKYQPYSDPKCKDKSEKEFEKWRFMRDVLKTMIQGAANR